MVSSVHETVYIYALVLSCSMSLAGITSFFLGKKITLFLVMLFVIPPFVANMTYSTI